MRTKRAYHSSTCVCTDGIWDKTGANIIPIGTETHPVRQMIVIGPNIWCTVRNMIKIIDSETLEQKVFKHTCNWYLRMLGCILARRFSDLLCRG